MKVLVIGSGCREHAIVQVLLEDENTTSVYSLPERVSLKKTIGLPSFFLDDREALADYLRKEGVKTCGCWTRAAFSGGSI